MELIRFANYEELSDFAATEIANAIKEKPTLVLCMASGHTPARTAELLAKKLVEQKIDYSRITFLGLDEWVGLSPINEGSCYYFFNKKIFEPARLDSSQCHLFDALATDLQAECTKMDDLILRKGGIDIMLVGIGMNGHIGFNEPGTSFDSMCHVATLDSITKDVGQKYFNETTSLDQGITIGLKHLLSTKKVLLLANGSKKAAVIKQTVEGTVTERFPASSMQKHLNGYVIVDEDAAAQLIK